jgi:virginiamycin A acetyltransferase
LSPHDILSPDADWRPGALATWWAGLPAGPRSFLRRWVNPDNQTRIHLAKLLARRSDQITIGAFTYGRPKVRFPESGAQLSIGRYGSIADGVEILLGGNHRTDWATTYPFPALPGLWPAAHGMSGHDATRGDVTIGHDVWLGSQAMIMSGVTIGHGAVVAARAVVTRDVPPYAIVAGNAAKVVKMRFDDRTIWRLLAVSWWDWPVEKISRSLNAIRGADISLLEAAV